MLIGVVGGVLVDVGVGVDVVFVAIVILAVVSSLSPSSFDYAEKVLRRGEERRGLFGFIAFEH